jgi:hypothetical protein
MMEATQASARYHRRFRARLLFHCPAIGCVLVEGMYCNFEKQENTDLVEATGRHLRQPPRTGLLMN